VSQGVAVAAGVGFEPTVTDAELIAVSVIQAVLDHHDESRWLRHAGKGVGRLLPHRLSSLAPPTCGGSNGAVPARAARVRLWSGGRSRLLRLERAQALGPSPRLITTVHGLPVAFTLTNPKVDERERCWSTRSNPTGPPSTPHGSVVDNGSRDATTDRSLAGGIQDPLLSD
jgi:hypothetical protein